MKCLRCLADVPEGVAVCPKCGGTVFSGSASEGPLRNVLQLYSTPLPFYVKAKPPVVVDGELKSFEVEWKLFKARLQPNAPSIFLWDRDGYLPGKQEAALHLVEGEDLMQILQALPRRKIEEILRVLREEWGVVADGENDNPVEVIASYPLFFQPVPKLRDPSILERMDWREYVYRLACPKPGKDETLIKVHLAKILQPLAMQYAPHSIEVTNSGTGKTRFYDAAGVKVDKATRRAFLGFAKSPNEVFPGTVHGTTLPVGIDQVESQDSYELAKYMLDLMESGRALVDSGGVRFVVETGSSFAYLGNPISKDAKAIEGFKALLNHICANPAMGRRFGIILFSTTLKTITGQERMTLKELEEWKRNFILFRAVEEYAQPKLKRLIRDPKVAEWLHQPIKGYREAIYSAVGELDDYNLISFFECHAEAEHRVRGAALHAAVALLLDKIALDKITVEEILEEAEDLLSDYVNINLTSIATLCRMWDKLRADQAKVFYENLPDYMREIVSAIIHHKRHNPDAVCVQLDTIPYEPENKDSYQYFSRCINKLKQRKNLEALNETLRNFFGFQIERNGDIFTVTYFENPKPPDDLRLIGKYGGFHHLTDLTISPSPQTGTPPESQSQEREKQPSKEGEGVSEKTVKWLNRLNGENQTEVSSKIDVYRCGECRHYRACRCLLRCDWVCVMPAHPACEHFEPKEEGGA